MPLYVLIVGGMIAARMIETGTASPLIVAPLAALLGAAFLTR